MLVSGRVDKSSHIVPLNSQDDWSFLEGFDRCIRCFGRIKIVNRRNLLVLMGRLAHVLITSHVILDGVYVIHMY